MNRLLKTVVLFAIFQYTLQDCPEEISLTGIRVKWNKTPTASNIESDPLCFINGTVVKRNCTDSVWNPAIDEITPCDKFGKSFIQSTCPPGFFQISEINSDYCYKVDSSSRWDFPCFTSGGASVITDLVENELDSLIDSLVDANLSRYYWLPAQRQKVFNPVVWSIPGPNWGQDVVTNNGLKFHNLFWKNCLALDVRQRAIITCTCAEAYPSLCFYINNIHYPAVCPENYYAFRYKPDNGTCYGVEKVEPERSLTYSEFIDTKCHTPMTADTLNIFIFTKIAELNELHEDRWCWLKLIDDKSNGSIDPLKSRYLEGSINGMGTVGILNSTLALSCMACETEVVYGDTNLMFEYNEPENQIYLTIYFPSGLWKYNYGDKGIQCFSDAKGFVRVVDISDLPYMIVQDTDEYGNQIEKIVYTINLVTNRSAQYWCEGHTFNFSLISTDKIIVNPKGKEIHVFSMTINFNNITDEIESMPELKSVLSIIAETLDVYKILLMDIFELTDKYMTVLLHVHVTVLDEYDDEALNILEQYNDLKERAILNLPSINCTFINLTSSVYCLPTTSNDYVTLDWELTPIGHISAPKQFCLQSNGLPVKRQCLGSYHLGGKWGTVEGQCDGNYEPSETTTFLYTIVKGQAPENYTSRFITDGLGFVLNDVDTIIPADIYYLSMSLKQVLDVVSKNETCVDIGDIDNIAWVMNRVMNLDYDYMRLAQTLNSTNVILNSVNDIIEMIASQDLEITTTDIMTPKSKHDLVEQAYQVAIKPQYIVQISYPELCNVTGLAIHWLSSSENLTDLVLKPLYANTTLEDVLAIDNLEVATWLPTKLLNSLKMNENETMNEETTNKHLLHVIVSVFENDVIFQELEPRNHVVNSRVVGVSIPGYLPNLKYPLPIIFKEITKTNYRKRCSFWDFQPTSTGQSLGVWKSNGCFPVYSKDNFTICECYHLTHFSQLISIRSNTEAEKNSEDDKHNKALNTITLIGAFLSLMGVIGIWVTAIVFSNWRRKAGTKVLLQLSTAIALPLVFIIISNIDDAIFVKVGDGFVVKDNTKIACVVLGALLHYSILASFMWMLITAVLQFIRYVRVLGVSLPSRFMFKFALIGWGIPLIPVIVVLLIDYESYVPNCSTFKPLCYPKGYYFILGVMVPICIILIVNVVLFLLVLHSISRGSSDKMKSTDMDLVGAQLRLSIFLFFLLGLTWIFGIFSFTNNIMWSYLFCLTATLQGFVLFIYFIVCDPTTRKLWIALVKPPFSSPSTSRNSITSMS